ncbi:hypothetical protein LMG27177_01000 [Paraburkholderia fynbosensis]|uniref:Uncharacterized protein n=1 Tax=Paraburkholderia fynbosensis TaxID=1200993 RepID=A0A6J5FI33_9BURK|nr:hypothetical protein LMG27177_01000 [Paraburkholderia fynbosensis]
MAKTAKPDTLFCSRDVSAFMPEEYKLVCIEEHYPVWATDLHAGPFTVCSYGTGDEALCPKHLTKHPRPRAIGSRRAAAGNVCDECKAVYALTSIIPTRRREAVACVCNFRDQKVITVSARAD